MDILKPVFWSFTCIIIAALMFIGVPLVDIQGTVISVEETHKQQFKSGTHYTYRAKVKLITGESVLVTSKDPFSVGESVDIEQRMRVILGQKMYKVRN